MNDITTIDRLSIMQAALKKLPLNPLGLPDIIYRPDLLPTDPQPETFDDALKLAEVQLSYMEGFPTLPSGLPFWGPLDFEPQDSFQLFERYLQLGHDVRVGSRQLHLLEDENTPRSMLIECFTYYYWPYRAKAHDIFRSAASRRTRELLALDLEDRHFKKANELYDQLMYEIFEGGGDDSKVREFWETIGPHGAIKLLKMLVDWQRLSIGLPSTVANSGYGGGFGARSADPNQNLGQGAPFELIFRQIAQKMHGSDGNSVNSGQTYEDRAQNSLIDLRKLLSTNNEVASLAQELIIRMSQPKSLEPPPVASHLAAAQGDLKLIVGEK
jgi:hypothetical protein